MTDHASLVGALNGGHMQGEKHLVPLRVYFTVFGILMVLTGLTVSASFMDLGPFNTVVALVIAVTKMLLVVLYFMHVRYSSRLTWAVIGAGFFWLALLLLMTLADYVTRGVGWLHYG